MPVALSLLISLPSWSADFDKGLAAYKRGDYATAIREWRPLAEQEHACAQFNLRVMYERGEGVVQDYGQAVQWYRRRAAEQGYAMAQNNLGVMYGLGDSVLQNYVTAYRWRNIARPNGNKSRMLLDALEQLMIKDQIAEAQQRASDRMANRYKNF